MVWKPKQAAADTGDRTEDSDSVDQAMNRVLLAEREARDAVAHCRSEAARILAAAEEDARRIAERAEGRVSLANRIANRTVERALREPRSAEAPAERAGSETEVQDLLERAVEELVEEMLGAEA